MLLGMGGEVVPRRDLSLFGSPRRIDCTNKYSSAARINVSTIIPAKITFDSARRDKTLTERDLDFAQAGEVCGGRNLTQPDTRGTARRIIGMRKANDREIKRVEPHWG